MELLEIMKARHSVRQYTAAPIETEKRAALSELAESLNREHGLHVQILYDEPKCFDSFMAHYGKFTGVRNYIAMIGKNAKDLDERVGWFGERLVLLAQTLGLNTCWVALSYGKGAVKKAVSPEKGEKLVCVIALGYGETQGEAHESRPLREVFRSDRTLPEWFGNGLKAALLAPTAINQQRFRFTLLPDDSVKAESTGGAYSHVDLGIVKYHFFLGAGAESVRWAE